MQTELKRQIILLMFCMVSKSSQKGGKKPFSSDHCVFEMLNIIPNIKQWRLSLILSGTEWLSGQKQSKNSVGTKQSAAQICKPPFIWFTWNNFVQPGVYFYFSFNCVQGFRTVIPKVKFLLPLCSCVFFYYFKALFKVVESFSPHPRSEDVQGSIFVG